jgi:hypothetical protein
LTSFRFQPLPLKTSGTAGWIPFRFPPLTPKTGGTVGWIPSCFPPLPTPPNNSFGGKKVQSKSNFR